jgi:D-arabinose 1-dehydrogenase-like Zn-dependent alcohol dehydrogenase
MRFPTEPGALGHEGWGVVDALGDGVEGLAVGDRVAALSYKSYAEYDLADAEAVVPLPDALAGRPFPGEPLGCAMNIFRRSGIEAGQTVAVVGIGFLGGDPDRLRHGCGERG